MATKNQSKSKPMYVGVDLGGTKILAGVFNAAMQCLGTAKVRTKPTRESSEIISSVAACVREVADTCGVEISQLAGVGIGCPGSVNPDSGEVLFAGNLGWKNVPLKTVLEKQLGIPVFAENDCNVATLGVHELELDGKPDHMAGLFLGTGIGGGLILNRKLYSGPTHTAFEIGHMVMEIDGPECTSGIRGTFEALASRTAIQQRILDQVQAGRTSWLTENMPHKVKKLRSQALKKAVAAGDDMIIEAIDESARVTGIAVANLINILNLQLFVIGGGIIEALGDRMLPRIITAAREHSFPGAFDGVRILPTRLSDDAGICGSAVLVKRGLS